ncbi:hypothetical protein [Flavobacterium sp. 3HN19-14]|uniref:hypothetical protein n=1 Tax=Flavobacterium sp. 3HN19-14 TaxID=3448133 RepID=UPI003EE0CAF3
MKLPGVSGYRAKIAHNQKDMKQLLIFLSFFLACCKSNEKEHNIKTFIFSNASMHSDYSLKLNSSDTIYFEDRFEYPKGNYYAILKSGEKDSIFNQLEKIDFRKYLSDYSDDHLSDGTAFRLLVVKANKIDSIFVYGDKVTNVFYNVASILRTFKKQKKFLRLDKNIDFENLNYKMLPPPPPPPPAPKIKEIQMN